MEIIAHFLVLLALLPAIYSQQPNEECTFERQVNGVYEKVFCFGLQIIFPEDNRWSLYNGSHNNQSGPINDHSLGNSNGVYLRFDSSAQEAYKHDGLYPVIIPNLQANSEPMCLVFWSNTYSSDAAAGSASTLQVFRKKIDFDPIEEKLYTGARESQNEWMLVTIEIAASQKAYNLIFKSEVRANNMGNIGIDDIVLWKYPCSGINKDNGKPANVIKEWTSWSECSKSCGEGTKFRKRECLYPPCTEDNTFESKNCTDGCRRYSCPTVDTRGYFDCNWDEDESCSLMVDMEHNWMEHSGLTPSQGTGPNGDNTMNNGCGKYLLFEASGLAEGTVGYVVTPAKVYTGDKCLSFSVSMYSDVEDHMGSLRVYIWQDHMKTILWQNHGVLRRTGHVSGQNWVDVHVNLENVPNKGSEYWIVFEATRGSGEKSDIAIDDVRVAEEACIAPVNGNWGKWNEWSCEVKCGSSGSASRSRNCSSPEPSNGGSDCLGNDKEYRECTNLPLCKVTGSWTEWTAFTECTVTCNSGTKYRYRECKNSTMSVCLNTNSEEATYEQQTESCMDIECLAHGNWGEWRVSNCTDCGSTSVQTGSRSRECNDPAPSTNPAGNPCIGNTTETVNCRDVTCHVDGVWSEWSNYSICDPTCGEQVNKTRTRTCDGRQGTGNDCDRNQPSSESMDCGNPDVCPVDGVWSEWSAYSLCDPTCGEQLNKTRTRTCVGRQGTGRDCDPSEPASETVDCGTPLVCPVDGVWSEWSNYSICDPTCGQVNKLRTRTCVGRQGTGRDCDPNQPSSESVDCGNPSVCPVDGGWSAWQLAVGETACDSTCDQARNISYIRTCTNPSPQGTGRGCDGISNKTEQCINPYCADASNCNFEITNQPQTCEFNVSRYQEPHRWNLETSQSTRIDHGPLADHTEGDGDYYLGFDAFQYVVGCPQDDCTLGADSQYFSLENQVGLTVAMERCIVFWVFMSGNYRNPGTFKVVQVDNVDSSEHVLFTRSNLMADWQMHTAQVKHTNNYEIRFEMTRDNIEYDVAIDDVYFINSKCEDVDLNRLPN